MTEEGDQAVTDDLAHWHRTMGPMAFNRAWELLDQTTLNSDEEDEMLSATFAQRYHWYEVGDARNWAIAEWQVSRVTAVLGHADLARRFGRRSLEVARAHDLGPFLEGFAHEAIARAAAVVDDVDTFTEHVNLAWAFATAIEDDDERETLESDLKEMSQS